MIDPAVALSSTAGAEVATALPVTCRPAASTSAPPCGQRGPAAPPHDDEGVRCPAAEVVKGRLRNSEILVDLNHFFFTFT